jgi:hypothetical protein
MTMNFFEYSACLAKRKTDNILSGFLAELIGLKEPSGSPAKGLYQEAF